MVRVQPCEQSKTNRAPCRKPFCSFGKGCSIDKSYVQRSPNMECAYRGLRLTSYLYKVKNDLNGYFPKSKHHRVYQTVPKRSGLQEIPSRAEVVGRLHLPQVWPQGEPGPEGLFPYLQQVQRHRVPRIGNPLPQGEIRPAEGVPYLL